MPSLNLASSQGPFAHFNWAYTQKEPFFQPVTDQSDYSMSIICALSASVLFIFYLIIFHEKNNLKILGSLKAIIELLVK